MPDPVLYTQAMAVAAVVSALCLLPTAGARSATAAARMNLACVLALGMGLLAGYRVLHLRCHWPPVNGLDRLLTVVLPATFSIEILASWPRAPRWVVWSLRTGLLLSTPRILLHDSIYLGGPHSPWTAVGSLALLALATATLVAVWWLMVTLAHRTSATSVLLSLALATQTTAIAIILAGYVTGGAAALPLTAALIGIASVVALPRIQVAAPGAAACGVIGLFGLLFVGRFFGGLSTPQALTILCAPVLCSTAELPPLLRYRTWQRTLFSLLIVALPLLIVLLVMKRTFDRETRPLLGIRNPHFDKLVLPVRGHDGSFPEH